MAIPDTRVKRFIEDRDPRVSVGLDFPISSQAGDQMGYFATTKTTIDAIKNDIRLLLLTQRGERLFQPFLGMDIRRFLFEQITDETAIEIENDIVDTFQTWLPFVELQDIRIDLGDQDRNTIKINVTINIRNAPTELQSVGVVLE